MIGVLMGFYARVRSLYRSKKKKTLKKRRQIIKKKKKKNRREGSVSLVSWKGQWNLKQCQMVIKVPMKIIFESSPFVVFVVFNLIISLDLVWK